jgi:hypothetical protein
MTNESDSDLLSSAGPAKAIRLLERAGPVRAEPPDNPGSDLLAGLALLFVNGPFPAVQRILRATHAPPSGSRAAMP